MTRIAIDPSTRTSFRAIATNFYRLTYRWRGAETKGRWRISFWFAFDFVVEGKSNHSDYSDDFVRYPGTIRYNYLEMEKKDCRNITDWSLQHLPIRNRHTVSRKSDRSLIFELLRYSLEWIHLVFKNYRYLCRTIPDRTVARYYNNSAW